tara:strand:- start:196 stop:393 length:198 start_codon:yes stop_codon:yes gene_type:complete
LAETAVAAAAVAVAAAAAAAAVAVVAADPAAAWLLPEDLRTEEADHIHTKNRGGWHFGRMGLRLA